MLAAKHTGKEIPPVSVRLEEEEYEKLGKVSAKYPVFSRNQMVRAAVRQWTEDALRFGVDANLQPLKKGA